MNLPSWRTIESFLFYWLVVFGILFVFIAFTPPIREMVIHVLGKDALNRDDQLLVIGLTSLIIGFLGVATTYLGAHFMLRKRRSNYGK